MKTYIRTHCMMLFVLKLKKSLKWFTKESIHRQEREILVQKLLEIRTGVIVERFLNHTIYSNF